LEEFHQIHPRCVLFCKNVVSDWRRKHGIALHLPDTYAGCFSVVLNALVHPDNGVRAFAWNN
jgi:hypothetical protein